ncbi:hypothetical protein ACFFX1_54645 [Dactylosporangium sucinum]|uniref:Uncharacterized protein n=1 Tax=Dactylosporangium sucinum TaxID=1424081 RepID=A0A917X290_9ACTN|nr:hypothetical protein [Dactylosporangium sucinum]GGM53846.1 hypothetical protein GCM10007977_064290 [Dactylosporangium sucinum]
MSSLADATTVVIVPPSALVQRHRRRDDFGWGDRAIRIAALLLSVAVTLLWFTVDVLLALAVFGVTFLVGALVLGATGWRF